MDEKRGQITLFIIVGILILFSVGFIIYVATIRPDLNIFVEKETELQQYIGFCIERTAEDAIVRVGITGGYDEIPEEIAINERAYFSFSKNTEPKIPLWYYREEDRALTPEQISNNIENIILRNIDDCLADFENFKDRYDFEMVGNKSIDAVINKDNVLVTLNYPVETTEKRTGEKSLIGPTARKMDVKLGKMYDMARDIMNSENRQLFFENATINLLSVNLEGFPFTGMDFSCAPKIWKKSELITFAKNMISGNIRKVTVDGNSIDMFAKDDLYSRNNLAFRLQNTYRDVSAVFQYPTSSRFEMRVNPNNREILRSNVGKPLGSVIGAILPFCINTYHFTYDIEYPILATLKDEKAFQGRGFVFNFAFPVTINHNQGDKTDFPISVFESPDYSYDFCEEKETSETDIRVKNAFTYEDIYGANITYVCVRLQCELGATGSDYGIYRLRTAMPSTCTGGVLTANKEGYLEGKTQYDGSGYAEILVKPVKTFRVNVTLHDSNNFDRFDVPQDGDLIMITLRSRTEPDFERTYMSGKNSPMQTLELVDGDGTYYVEAMAIQDGTRLIGGYIGDWTVTYSELYEKEVINFKIAKKVPLAVTEQEQIDAASYIFDDKTYQEALKPTFN